jgi:hypothetical protein
MQVVLFSRLLLDLITLILLQFDDEYCQKLMSLLQASGKENAFVYGGWLQMNWITSTDIQLAAVLRFDWAEG